MNLPKEMATRGMVISCSEARRFIGTGHVVVNGEIVTEIDATVTKEDTIQVGKRPEIYGFKVPQRSVETMNEDWTPESQPDLERRK